MGTVLPHQAVTKRGFGHLQIRLHTLTHVGAKHIQHRLYAGGYPLGGARGAVEAEIVIQML